MKYFNQIKALMGVLLTASLFWGTASFAQDCGSLQNSLSQCQADLSTQQTAVTKAADNLQSAQQTLANLKAIRETTLPQCRRQVEHMRERDLGEVQALDQGAHEHLAAAQRENSTTSSQYQALYAQKFVKWVCAIKDREHAEVGYGEGPNQELARADAITKGNIGSLVKKHGSFDFCFPVFRN